MRPCTPVLASLLLALFLVAPSLAQATIAGDLVVTPATATVAPGGQITFSSNAPGACNWSLSVNGSGATIDPATGHYTAGHPATATDDLVMATYQAATGVGAVHVAPVPDPGLSSGGGGGCATGGGAGSLLGLLALKPRWRRRGSGPTARG